MSRATEGRTAPGPAIGDGFTLLAAGDLISSRPLSPRLAHDAAFGEVARLLGGASLAVGNMETSIVDMRTFGGHPRTVDDWCMAALPAVAGTSPIWASGSSLAPTTTAATGASRACARPAGIWMRPASSTRAPERRSPTPARRATSRPSAAAWGSSSYAAQKMDNDAALDQFGEVPARPGLSALRIALTATAPKPVVDGLRDVYRKAYPGSA